MKISLQSKILGAFALIVLTALTVAAGAGNRLMRLRYDDFALGRDIGRAERMAEFLGPWTVQAAAGDPEDQLPVFVRVMIPPGPGSHQRQNKPRMLPGNSPDDDLLVITDPKGVILFDASDSGKKRLSPEGGIRIQNGEVTAGYLFVGRMIPGSDFDSALFRTFRNTNLMAAGIVFILAMILGILLTRHIVTPVRQLGAAANQAENGNLAVRVPDKRRDELGDLARSFNSMIVSLDSAERQRRRLIADSAHELRTPVTLIQTRIEMMEEGVYPVNQDSLAALSAEAGRLTTLVEELKTLSDLESRGYKPSKEQFSLNELAAEIVSSAGPAGQKEGIKIELTADAADKTVFADAPQIRRLLTNLLSNALRFASGRISVTCQTADTVIMTVEDDGPGIPEPDTERIFERYFRSDQSRSRSSGGSGLGLAICREIILAHGGSIRSGKSAKLGGALIQAELPAQKE